MNILKTIKSLFRKFLFVPNALVTFLRIFREYVISVGEQKISPQQLKRLLDSKASPIHATPIVSYIDWVERNDKAGLFENYPQIKEYQWIKTYPSKVDRMHLVVSFLQSTKNITGDIAEFGVYKGHTAILLNQFRREWNNGKKLHLFDSFEGLPDEIGQDDGFVAGQFSDTSVERVRQVVGNEQDVQIVKGFFKDSFPNHPELKFSFCHIDCDLEIAVIECLEYIYPRLSFGGIIVFDDYGFRACVGLRKAVDDFFAKKNQKVISLPTSQAVYVKLD